MQKCDPRSLHAQHYDGVIGRAEEIKRIAEVEPGRLELQDVAGLKLSERDLSPEVEVIRPACARLPQRLIGERPAFPVAHFPPHL